MASAQPPRTASEARSGRWSWSWPLLGESRMPDSADYMAHRWVQSCKTLAEVPGLASDNCVVWIGAVRREGLVTAGQVSGSLSAAGRRSRQAPRIGCGERAVD